MNLSHSCESKLHDECLGVARFWDERFCSCRDHVMPTPSVSSHDESDVWM